MVKKVVKKVLKKLKSKGFIQFIKFCIIGVSNTLISYVIYVIVLLTLQHFKMFEVFNYMIAHTLGFIIGVIWSYVWNSKFVFHKDTDDVKTKTVKIIKTYTVNIISSLILANVMLYVWIDVLHISNMIAPFLNVIITTPINFIANKFWIHKDK